MEKPEDEGPSIGISQTINCLSLSLMFTMLIRAHLRHNNGRNKRKHKSTHQNLSPFKWSAWNIQEFILNYPVKGQLTSHGQKTPVAEMYVIGDQRLRPLSHSHYSLSSDPMHPSGYI